MGNDVNENATEILQILKRTLPLPDRNDRWGRDPFKTLVATIISQNTTDSNSARAFERLSKRFEITPEVLMNAPISQIQDAIKPAGLYKNKAHSIKQAACTIAREWQGNMRPTLALPVEQAREALMHFQGVGPKTADIVLLFAAETPTIPVDTHVHRVAKRLGFTPFNGSYEIVRKNLERLFVSEEYLNVHLLLVAHGRKTCKARHPLCDKCALNTYCPTRGQWN